MSSEFRESVWQRQGASGWASWVALQPATALYAAAVRLRAFAYDRGLLEQASAGIPVVSVGNLTVGGTGKTPMTLWLARQLSARGHKVGILLRGYTGRASGVTVASRGQGFEARIEDVGDEAAMLAKCFGGVVVTSAKRVDGAKQVEALGCDLILLDDGFQHRALARDFDLVLVSRRRGSMLPSGPMREGWSALRRADAVALTIRGEEEAALPLPEAVAAYAPRTFVVRFRPNALVEADAGIWTELPISTISGARVAVVSGIAEPQAFYATLHGWGADVKEVAEYPDHHPYTSEDWQRVTRYAREADLIVTTEKDLIKLERFPFEKGKLVAVRVEPEVDAPDDLLELIEQKAAR